MRICPGADRSTTFALLLKTHNYPPFLLNGQWTEGGPIGDLGQSAGAPVQGTGTGLGKFRTTLYLVCIN